MNTQSIFDGGIEGVWCLQSSKRSCQGHWEAWDASAGSRIHLETTLQKQVAFQVAFTAWEVSQPCPGVEGCGGTVPPPELPFFSKAFGSSPSPKLVLQSFIVPCYTECSFSVPLPSDLILENKINCHLS